MERKRGREREAWCVGKTNKKTGVRKRRDSKREWEDCLEKRERERERQQQKREGNTKGEGE